MSRRCGQGDCITIRAGLSSRRNSGLPLTAAGGTMRSRPDNRRDSGRMPMRCLDLSLLMLGISLAAMPAEAQSFTPDQADRAAAVREGTLSWYTSTPFPLVQQLADKFAEQTGVKVQIPRSGGEAVIRRFLQEHQAGQQAADVL